MSTTTAVDVEQVIALARKLTPEGQQRVMEAMRRDTSNHLWREVQRAGTQRMREYAAKCGLLWDELDEAARQRLIDELMGQGD